MSVPVTPKGPAGDGRAAQIQAERLGELHRSTDRMFAVLMLVQWFGAIVLALVVSPRTWIGTVHSIHLHVWAAVLFGALLASLPIFLVLTQPGRPVTRHVIAFSQMLWSVLLIHLTGGRIETHFHVFGSLAFLAFYRDWRVLVTATVVVAVDHWVRGVWWPQSVFGIFISSPYRWLEHAAWVIFEDIFLVLSCLRGQREVAQAAQRQVDLEREVTQRKRTEQSLETTNTELARRNEEMQQFIYTVSHDLKSPIVTCLGFLGMMKEDIAAGRQSDVDESMGRIERSVTRMKRAIEDLLELSRIGRIRSTPEAIDMNALVRQLCDDLRTRLQSQQAAVVINGHLPQIVADRERIAGVFENLLTNALKYGCPAPGMKIMIGASHRDGQARFYVRDEGPGIPAEYHRKVFGLFQRLHSRQEGSGVGLAIVERVVELYGGRAWVESEPGHGATFWVMLPTAGAEPATGHEAPCRVPGSGPPFSPADTPSPDRRLPVEMLSTRTPGRVRA